MGLVTSDEAVLCKLIWFTALKIDTIDSWYKLEKMFLDKFSTAGEIEKTRGMMNRCWITWNGLRRHIMKLKG